MVEKKTKKPGPGRKSAEKPAPRKAVPAAPKKRSAARKPSRPAAPAEPRPKAPVAEPAPPALAARGLHDLRPAFGATHSRKRVGRGPGSGHGKTAGRGNKGQKSRTGYRHQRGFEGGQMPLHRRVPKRGFTNVFRVEYDIVNLSDLAEFDPSQPVTLDALVARRLARKNRPVKILGDGEIGKALTVSAHKFSANARARIEAAGGRCEVLAR